MTDHGRRPSRIYRWGLARALSRVRHLLEPEEGVEAAAILQRGGKPLRAFVLMGVGATIFTPALTAPEMLVPDAVRWYVGIPLFVAGALLNAIPGQALLVVTAGTAYVISLPPLPGMRPRLLGDAPVGALEVDLERGFAAVAGQRLWALPLRGSSLRELAAGPGPSPASTAATPSRPLRRWAARLAGLVVVATAVGLLLEAAIETDGEEIERVILEYNNDLARGDGEGACAALARRARAELVEEATVTLGRPVEPPNCRRAVDSLTDGVGDAISASEADDLPVLGIDVEGDRAIARVGLSFTYQPIPMTRASDGWKLATTRATSVVRDVPAVHPPSLIDFAVRAEGLCRNSRRLFVPPVARLAALPDPETVGDAAQPVADLLAEISSADRILAAELSLLTPPRGARPRVQRVVGSLRRLVEVRDRYAGALVAGRSDVIAQASRSLDRAGPGARAAASDAGLGRALAGCV